MVDVRYSLPVFAEEFQLLIIRKGRHLTIYRCVNDEVVDLIRHRVEMVRLRPSTLSRLKLPVLNQPPELLFDSSWHGCLDPPRLQEIEELLLLIFGDRLALGVLLFVIPERLSDVNCIGMVARKQAIHGSHPVQLGAGDKHFVQLLDSI